MDFLIPDSDPSDGADGADGAETAEAAQRLLGEKDQVIRSLGSGKDGIVYSTSRRSVIKVLWTAGRYDRELAVYVRLAEHRVRQVAGLAVPSLVGHRRQLLAIEMTHVSPPYVIDFAQSAVDLPETYGQESMEMWRQSLEDNFGDRFADAMGVYNELVQRYGVYHYDLSVYNLRFDGDEDE